MSALTILVLEPEVLSSSLSQEKKQTPSRLRRKKGNCLLTHRQHDFYKMLGSQEQPKKVLALINRFRKLTDTISMLKSQFYFYMHITDDQAKNKENVIQNCRKKNLGINLMK